MQRYVATVQLKRVTDGDRTFWHWQSTFDTPRGREQEFADLVGEGVYEGGFEGLRAFLRRRPGAPAIGCRRAAGRRRDDGDAGHGREPLRRPGRARSRDRSRRRRRGRARSASGMPPIGVNYIDVYVRKGEYRLIEPPAPLGMEAAGVVLDVGDGVAHLLPGDRVAYACAPPGAYVGVRTLPANQVVVLPDEHRRGDGGGADAEGHDRRIPAASHPPRAGRARPSWSTPRPAASALLLCQWAKALGARVIGTVSTDDKARVARAAGCDVRHRRPRLPLRRRGARRDRPAAAPT